MDMVFLHGAADSGAVWERQVQHFSARHRVLALDLPGHGDRLAETPITSVEAYVGEVLAAVRAHGFDRPALIGHSMGGAAVLLAALDHPEAASALVLVGTGARLRIRPDLIEAARQVAESSPPSAIVDRLVTLDEAVSPTAPREVRDWLRARFGRATGRAVYGDFLATSGFDVMGRLGEIQLPTLIVAGEEDRWTPPKFQEYLERSIAGSARIMFADTGHYPFVERSERFNAELDRFLERL
ncbi:MAG TPA: alpha/beta hydrolase [Chloroflexota bacterium]|nr:alpha/beta hydrolase [Chloroflexota bacterium]